jgi:phytoene/squalene synthetase
MDELDKNSDNFVDYKEFLSALSTERSWAMSNPDELLRKARDDRLSYAYEQCKQLTSDYAKTFYLATLAMPAMQARATWAIYAWCRRVDEIVDGPSASPDAAVQEAALGGWMSRLDQMWEGVSTVCTCLCARARALARAHACTATTA